MRIIIFGANGLLGRYVSKYFRLKLYDVVEINRKDCDIRNTNKEKLNNLINSVMGENECCIINCAGVIKQKMNIYSIIDAILVNSVFPWMLNDVSVELNINVIHISTDCVFTGNDGNYNEDSFHDADDIYGRTKSLGEPDNITVIRTSIIGEELNGGPSLIEWVKSEDGNEINGFTNHVWNGITALEFAKITEQIIENNLYWKGVKHIFSSESLTKLKLVNLIIKIFDLNINVLAMESGVFCDRSLSSKYEPLVFINNIEKQLDELKNFKS